VASLRGAPASGRQDSDAGCRRHGSDIIEHPLGVADRIVRYANIVGKENVIAGTDCGLASRVGGPEICWAKLDALGKGAALATDTLFG